MERNRQHKERGKGKTCLPFTFYKCYIDYLICTVHCTFTPHSLIAQWTNVRSLVFWAAVKLLPPNYLLREWDTSISWYIRQNLERVREFKNIVLSKLIAEAFVTNPKVRVELLTLESCWQSGTSTPLWAGCNSKEHSVALKSCHTRTKMKPFIECMDMEQDSTGLNTATIQIFRTLK